ncbi:MAG: DUF1592 domain-containing protein [Verrucomicrobiota bacterium]
MAALMLSASVSFGVAVDYQNDIYPILDRLCYDCHEPGNSDGDIPFMEAETVEGIQNMRTVWRSVAFQIRNRTMPPPKKKQPTEEERELVASWIENYLRDTACDAGPYAGNVMARRLNRLEFDRTIRDLCGVELNFSESFPADSGTGEGFDNNGESLFLPPVLMERYLEAAQKIVDAAIVTPPLQWRKAASAFEPQASGYQKDGARRLAPGEKVNAYISIYVDGNYEVVLPGLASGNFSAINLQVDGLTAEKMVFTRRPKNGQRFDEKRAELKMTRGVHAISIEVAKGGSPLELGEIALREKPKAITEEKAASHQKIFDFSPGQRVEGDPRAAATDILMKFVRSAYRRPIERGEVDRFLQLFDRGARRGDPFEECMKLALKGVLVSPDFLFRIETPPASEAIQPITNHELASRLSYFLWSTMPDAELTRLADEGKLNDEKVLTAQVDRMLADSQSEVFARAFIGQWLGTKDVGGRVAPTANDVQKYYKPEIAADMREEAWRFFHHLLTDNRNLLELVDAEYTFLTGRLASFYELPQAKKLPDAEFQKVALNDRTRGGVLGMGAVLALTSHHKKTSPVLRGAWVFDTLIGTPIPPPPPGVPPLQEKKKGKKLTDREQLQLHREDANCMSCHQLIDPVGFGLQNFDFVGRWRDEQHGQPIDTAGKFPTGESFSGPGELKRALLETRKPEIVRNIVRKLLAYGLGRGLDDRDDCTIRELELALEENGYRSHILVKGIVLSTPFRNRQFVPDSE